MIVLVVFLLVSPWARRIFMLETNFADKNHLAYLDSIALGCMSAIIAARFTFKKWINWTFLLTGLSMVILILYFRSFVYKSGMVDLGLNITMLSFGVGLILLWLHHRHQTGKERDRWFCKWLKQMGIYSYEIYLTHMFVVLFGVKIYKYLELSAKWLVPSSLIIILISFLLGSIIYNYFSEPLNLWLRHRLKTKK